MIESEEQGEKRLKKSEQSLRPMRHCRSLRRREKGTERIFKRPNGKNLPNLMKDVNINIQQTQ